MSDVLPPPEHDEATWRCQDCGSTCNLKPEEVPEVCQFCASADIIMIAPAADDPLGPVAGDPV